LDPTTTSALVVIIYSFASTTTTIIMMQRRNSRSQPDDGGDDISPPPPPQLSSGRSSGAPLSPGAAPLSRSTLALQEQQDIKAKAMAALGMHQDQQSSPASLTTTSTSGVSADLEHTTVNNAISPFVFSSQDHEDYSRKQPEPVERAKDQNDLVYYTQPSSSPTSRSAYGQDDNQTMMSGSTYSTDLQGLAFVGGGASVQSSSVDEQSRNSRGFSSLLSLGRTGGAAGLPPASSALDFIPHHPSQVPTNFNFMPDAAAVVVASPQQTAAASCEPAVPYGRGEDPVEQYKPELDSAGASCCQRRRKLLFIVLAAILVIIGVVIGVSVGGKSDSGEESTNGSETDSAATRAVGKYMTPTWFVANCSDTNAPTEQYPHVISQCFCRDGTALRKEDMNDLILHPAVLAQYGYLYELTWLYLPPESILSTKNLSVPGDVPSCDSASLSLLWLAANILGTVSVDENTRAGTQTDINGVVQLKGTGAPDDDDINQQFVSSDDVVVAVQSDWTQRFALAVLAISTTMNNLESDDENMISKFLRPGSLPSTICLLAENMTANTEFSVDEKPMLSCSATSVVSTVVDLRLQSQELVGSIPVEMALLYGLTFLDLSDNGLTGSFPFFLAAIPGIESLTVSLNQLNGTLFGEAEGDSASLREFTNLKSLGCEGNSFSGTIPSKADFWSSLRKLEDLLVGLNDLTGPIPPAMGLATSLRRVSFHQIGVLL
jgi:hypothetical protein